MRLPINQLGMGGEVVDIKYGQLRFNAVGIGRREAGASCDNDVVLFFSRERHRFFNGKGLRFWHDIQ